MNRKVIRVWHDPINVDGKIFNTLEIAGNCVALHEHFPTPEVPLHYIGAKFKDGKRIHVYNILSVEYQDVDDTFNKTAHFKPVGALTP